MSLFTDASMVLVPSGIKNQKIYSVTPTDGSGDLTFSRASSATRVNSSGLVEKVRTNLALYSEQFDNATWTKNNSSITANATTAPNSTITADKLIENTVNNTHYAAQNVTLSNAVYTYSVYIKADTTTRVRVQMSDLTTGDVRLDYNFSTETAAYNASGTRGSWGAVGYEITALTGGWTRFSLSGLKGAGSVISASVFLLDASGNSTYTGDGTSGLFLWGAQLETGDIATDYIATTSAAVSVGPVANLPRLDYSGGATCPSLKLEPQSTNIQLNSEDFSQANWSKTNSAIVVNQLASPDGYLNADKLNETAINNIHQLESSRSLTSGNTYTMSVFAKKGERDFVRLYEDSYANSAYFNLNTGVLGTVSGPTASAKIEAIGSDGWYRCYLTYTETSNNFGRYRIAIAKQDNEVSYLGVAGSGIYVWGAQYEEGAYATSYIPTLSAAVTRGADAAYKTSASALIGATAGTMFIEVENNPNAYLFSAPNNVIFASINAGSYLENFHFTTDNASVYVYCNSSSGALQAAIGTTLPNTSTLKMAVTYTSSAIKFFLNGVLVGTDTSFTLPSGMSRVDVGHMAGQPDSQRMRGRTKQFLLFESALSDADAITLTTL